MRVSKVISCPMGLFFCYLKAISFENKIIFNQYYILDGNAISCKRNFTWNSKCKVRVHDKIKKVMHSMLAVAATFRLNFKAKTALQVWFLG